MISNTLHASVRLNCLSRLGHKDDLDQAQDENAHIRVHPLSLYTH